jgi:predicted 2-oxoglutarate/Fe(II)-dependent dioxygenase YbiX
MLIKGYQKLKKALSQHECDVAANVIIEGYNQGKLQYENDGGKIYRDSYGQMNLPGLEDIYEKMTNLAATVTGLKLKKASNYCRIYFSNSMLPPHVDRETLDLTMSITLLNRTGKECPLSLETYDGVNISHTLEIGDAILVKGRDLKHWRGDLGETEGPLVCVFMHWQIEEAESEEYHEFLSKETCAEIIKYSDSQALLEQATVLQGKDNNYDPNSRSCLMTNIKDSYGLKDKLKKTLGFPELDIECFQFLKYEAGGEFKPHFDAVGGGNPNDRLFTCIVYLNEDYKGGETILHHNNKVFKPETGKLILWKNLLSGKSNPHSLHSGAKVIEGVKYILVMWILQSFKEK